MAPKVSVIISNRNDVAMLVVTIRSCIEEFVPLGKGGGEIVVCDNSDEPVYDRLQSSIPSGYIDDKTLKIVRQNFPCLFSARELAIREATGDYIICLDSHMLTPRDGIAKLADFMDRHSGDRDLGFAHAPLSWAHHHESRARHDRDMSRGELGPWGGAYKSEGTITWKGMPWMCRKDWFLDKEHGLGGYGALSEHKVSWGGGDMHIGVKPWLLGFKNWAVPTRPFIHIGPFPRIDIAKNMPKDAPMLGDPLGDNYKYRLYKTSGNYPHTFGFLVSCYVLGGEPMFRRNEPFLKGRFGRYIDVDKMWPIAKQLGEGERAWLDSRKIMSFEEMLEHEPWKENAPMASNPDSMIYKMWLSKVDDKRYLRPRRWDEIRRVIEENGVQTILEFGLGVSTLLFANKGMKRIVSYETDKDYIDMVVKYFSPPNNVDIRHWNNNGVANIPGKFDLALVDGALPRQPQLILAKRWARFIAIDDFIGAEERRLGPMVEGLERIDSRESFLAIFKNG